MLAAGGVAAEPGSVLDTVVVTGTAQRSAKSEVSSTPESLPASVTVISAEEIERVEVIRGPFSAEYGEDALGGAINMMSKRAEATPMLGLSGGSFDTTWGMASYSRGTEALPGGLVP